MAKILKTLKEKVAYLFKIDNTLRNGSNDDLIEAYRKQYKGDKAATESISRTWRAWKEEGLFKSR